MFMKELLMMKKASPIVMMLMRMKMKIEELKDIMDKNPELLDNSNRKIAWKGDALNKVLGDDKPGHNTHFTSVEDTPNEDMLAFRVEMEKLHQVNKNQDAKIKELEEKMRRMERQSNQEISDPMAIIGLEPSVDGRNSNRKRVLAPSVDGLQLVKKRSKNLQNKPSGSNDADLQESNKNFVLDKFCPLKYSLEPVIVEFKFLCLHFLQLHIQYPKFDVYHFILEQRNYGS